MFIMVYCLVIIFAIFIPIIIIAGVSSRKIKEHCDHQEEVNQQVNNNIGGFRATKTFYLTDNFTHDKDEYCKKMLMVNTEAEEVMLIDYENNKMVKAKFSEILNYEIYENGSHTTTGLGMGGFVGVFGAETNGNCKDLKLIIRLDKIDNSQVVYDIVSDTAMNIGISKSTKVYQKCIKSMQEVVSFLEVIKNRNSKTTE